MLKGRNFSFSACKVSLRLDRSRPKMMLPKCYQTMLPNNNYYRVGKQLIITTNSFFFFCLPSVSSEVIVPNLGIVLASGWAGFTGVLLYSK